MVKASLKAYDNKITFYGNNDIIMVIIIMRIVIIISMHTASRPNTVPAMAVGTLYHRSWVLGPSGVLGQGLQLG